MEKSSFGYKLNPMRKLRNQFGNKAIRQSICVTNNPSTIGQNQQLLVRFPNLGHHDVIVPGTARLAFTITLKSEDANRTIVQNIGRAIVKKTTIKISGNEVMSIDDSDIYYCYTDLWRTPRERENLIYQGIDTSENQNVNKLRIGAGNADEDVIADKGVSDAFGNRFFIPLDFELLESHMPFYQAALGDRLEYELTFNDYSRVVITSGEDGGYEIGNISLEFDVVSDRGLSGQIRDEYNGKMCILYDRVLRHRKILKDKSDTLWNINLNVPAKSMKGILMLFEDPGGEGKNWGRMSESFYNPKITKVETTIEGIPNQLYSQGMRAFHQWDEIRKFPNIKRMPEVDLVVKELSGYDVTLSEFIHNKYALWLDMRSTDDNRLHGSGRQIENASEGVTIQITKKEETAGPLNLYLYVVMDAQLNIEEGRFWSAIY